MSAVLLPDCGHQRVSHPRVVVLGLYFSEEFRPARLVFEDIAQYPAESNEEVGERKGPVRFLREPGDHNLFAEGLVGPDDVFDA